MFSYADLEKVFNVPRILNLPFSNVPQNNLQILLTVDEEHFAISKYTQMADN
jgi:hypothetical protein